MRTVQVAGSASGIVGNGDQPGSCGEVASAGEGAQVSGTDQQYGAEERPEAGHGLDDRGLRMLVESLLDLLVEGLQAFIEGEELAASSATMVVVRSWPGSVIDCALAASTARAAILA